MVEAEQVVLTRFASSRDSEAFRELVELHRDMVFAVCNRVLGNPADAEDAAQECFLQLVRKADCLRAPIGGWLHHVALQSAIDLRRRRVARTNRDVAAAQQRPVCQEPTWDSVKVAVDEAIAELPEELRAPIVLHYLEGRSLHETGAELGITGRAVSKRLARGLERLRIRMRKGGWVLSVAALAALLTANAAEAAPATLVASLGKMALASSGGTAATAAAPAATGGMFLKVSAVLAIAAALIGGSIAVSGILARRHTTPFTAARPVEGETPAKPAASNFVVAIPGQGTIGLVALSNYPSEGKTWWKPDGTRLDSPPIVAPANQIAYSTGKKAYALVYRISGLPAGNDYSWVRQGEGGGAGRRGVQLPDGRIDPDLCWETALFPSETRKADVKIGWESGEWETAAEIGADAPGAQDQSGEKDSHAALITKEYDDRGGITLTVTPSGRLTEGYAVRQAFIDDASRETGPKRVLHTSGSFQFKVPAGLLSGRVKLFRLQVRPIQWVEFHNVALAPSPGVAPLVAPGAHRTESVK